MKTYDDLVEMNNNPNMSFLSNNLYKILSIVSSGSSKTYVLLNLIKFQWPDIDQISIWIKV